MNKSGIYFCADPKEKLALVKDMHAQLAQWPAQPTHP